MAILESFRFRDASAVPERHERVYRAQVVRVPVLRAAGYAILSLSVLLHNKLVLGEFLAGDFALLVSSLAAYCIASWVILHLYYRVERTERALDVSWLFHLGDLLACGVAVYVSGAEASWIFLYLLVPIWNQTHFGVARALISGAIAALLYVGMIFMSLVWLGPEGMSLRLGFTRAAVILLVTMYCALSARIAEGSRSQVIEALRSARGRAEQQAVLLSSLNRLTQTISSAGDLPEVLAAMAREMAALFGATHCAITMRDDERNCLRVLAFFSHLPGLPEIRGYEIPYLANPSCSQAIETRRPIVVIAAQTNPMTVAVHDVFRMLGVQCVMVVPVVVQSEVIGTISIQTNDGQRVFTEAEMALAETAAAQVAPTVRNAQRYDEEKRSRELAERLQAAAAAMSQSLELNAVLDQILEQLQGVVGFDAASIQLIEGDCMRIIAVKGHPPSQVGHARSLLDHGYNRRLASVPEPCILNLPVPSDVWSSDAHATSLRSVLGVPLVVHDRIIGAMSIDSNTENAFSQRDADAASSFARFAAIAVENARLYDTLQQERAALSEAKQQLEVSNQKLTDLSSVDGLTGIPNRRRFDEVYAMEWRRSVRGKWPLSMAMIDVDDFKAFNDHYGHHAGDIVLKKVAQALSGALQRAGDFLARYGGEEFVVLLPATDLVRAAEHGERLRQRVAHLAIEHARGRAGPVVTISVGVATIFAREDGESASLLIAADQQLYTAKHLGRNQVSVAHVISQAARHGHAVLGDALGEA